MWISLLVLGATALLQLVIVALSGSVALLAETIHNATDALTAVPLLIAFRLGRRPPSPRYPYGLHRAEDLAGVAIVLMILASAVFAGVEAFNRLVHPHELRRRSTWIGTSTAHMRRVDRRSARSRVRLATWTTPRRCPHLRRRSDATDIPMLERASIARVVAGPSVPTA